MTAHLCIINGYLQSSVAIWDQADPNAYFSLEFPPSLPSFTKQHDVGPVLVEPNGRLQQ